MSKKTCNSRRNFLKASAGAVAATAITPGMVMAAPERKIINPTIDNLRVVCCNDPDMITGTPTRWNTIADQEAMIESVLSDILSVYKDRMLPDDEVEPDYSDAFDEILEVI